MCVGIDRNSMECELFMTGPISGQVMLKEGVPDLVGQTCPKGSLA